MLYWSCCTTNLDQCWAQLDLLLIESPNGIVLGTFQICNCLELLGLYALCFQATSGPLLHVPISLLLLVRYPQLMQLMQVLQLL